MLEDLGLDLGSIPNQLYNPEKIISFMKEVQQQWLQKIFGGGDVNEIMYVKALYVKYKCLFYINCLEVRWCYLEQKVTQESIILILSFYNKCFLGKWGHREAKYFLQAHFPFDSACWVWPVLGLWRAVRVQPRGGLGCSWGPYTSRLLHAKSLSTYWNSCASVFSVLKQAWL